MLDLDSLLDYEQDCFNRGRAEGLEAGKVQGHTEGRELGIQTGFQRYLAMGVLQARVENWARETPETSEQLETLAKLVKTDDLSNDAQVVEDTDRRIKLAKNKARIMAASRGSPKVNAHEQKISYQRDADNTTAIEDMY